MTQNEVMLRLKKLLTERLHLPADRVQALEPHALLLEDGLGLDSLDCIGLLLGMEEEFKITLEQEEEEEQWMQYFATLENLSQLVLNVTGESA